MIALYPGAFKPPHKGHFEVLKSLLEGTVNGTVYDLSNWQEKGADLIKGKTTQPEKIDEVIIFIGGETRNNISVKESKKIWESYLVGYSNVKVVIGGKNPMTESKEYAASNPDQQFYAVTGIRDESDMKDLRRVSTYKKVSNVQGLAVTNEKVSSVRATDFRSKLADINSTLQDIREYLPDHLDDSQAKNAFHILKKAIISEKMLEEVNDLFKDMFLSEGSSGTHIHPTSAIRSTDRNDLLHIFNDLRALYKDTDVNITFNQDNVTITKKHSPKVNIISQSLASLLEYMLEQKMEITPLPEVSIKRDIKEASDFFGRTAYYDPNESKIVLYVEGRHPKDIVRSFAHEMVHHMQNLKGTLGDIQTSNTNEDSHLKEIEKEAYLLGNITFRNWEDSIKNS